MASEAKFHVGRIVDNQSAFEGKILLVGGRTTNFPKSIWQHPRVVVWQSTHNSPERRRSIPKDVKTIVLLRFLDHKLRRRIASLVGDDVHIVPKIMNSGEATRFVLEKLGIEP